MQEEEHDRKRECDPGLVGEEEEEERESTVKVEEGAHLQYVGPNWITVFLKGRMPLWQVAHKEKKPTGGPDTDNMST